ncbi:corticotropin-releasing factor-binding protein isoform X2 [Chrysoperla carnea]|uniref:corticotropin-releasing factor-binding protein isoform X2 n=1 Tax=Chrysoperla carnea TaxID=189513 RepID=UPI001D090D2E|nr:corticotropin-releasing factor-binding protein isoform X2 [Chrysoperla carnea]
MHLMVNFFCILLQCFLVTTAHPLFDNLQTMGLSSSPSHHHSGVIDIGSNDDSIQHQHSSVIGSMFDPTGLHLSNSMRDKRREQHIISECMEVKSMEGEYFYKAGPDWEQGQACGLFLFTEPDKRIEAHFTYFDVPCQKGGLVSYVDGWELNGEFFPSIGDHPKSLDDRFAEFCGQRKIKQVFVSSQNAALFQYRMPSRGRGFSINVRFIKNPAPCNILMQGSDELYTLRNYNKRVNCSLTAIYPAAVRTIALSVGLASIGGNGVVGNGNGIGDRNMEIETGTLHKCNKRGLEDFVQIGGSDGLENSNLQIVDNICGLNSKPDNMQHTIFCGVTTIRLVSSGLFDNSVTVAVRKATEDDILEATHICGL